MKKNLFYIAAVAACFVSCTKDVDNYSNTGNAAQVNLVELSFSASADLTKAALDGLNVVFSADDEIAVFAEGTAAPYKFTTTAGGANATFTGTAPTASTYYALYPYSADATLDGNTIKNVNLSKTSVATDGTFASKQAIFVAKTTGTALAFKSVCAFLKITVPATITDLSEISIFNRATDLAGAVTGTFDVVPGDGVPAVTITAKNGGSSEPHTVGLSPATSGDVIGAGTYYLPVLPVSLTKGIDLKLGYSDFIGRVLSDYNAVFESGKVYNLGTITKTKIVPYINFENYTLTTSGQTQIGNLKGNSGALTIETNPVSSSSVNPSKKVFRNKTAWNETSGMFQTASNMGITTAVLNVVGTFMVKIYYGGDSEYYPHLQYNKGGTAINAARINGVAIDSKDAYDAAFKPADWNVYEWDASQLSKTNFSDMSGFTLRMFVDYNNNNATYDASTHKHIGYVDDISFVLK